MSWFMIDGESSYWAQLPKATANQLCANQRLLVGRRAYLTYARAHPYTRARTVTPPASWSEGSPRARSLLAGFIMDLAASLLLVAVAASSVQGRSSSPGGTGANLIGIVIIKAKLSLLLRSTTSSGLYVRCLSLLLE